MITGSEISPALVIQAGAGMVGVLASILAIVVSFRKMEDRSREGLVSEDICEEKMDHHDTKFNHGGQRFEGIEEELKEQSGKLTDHGIELAGIGANVQLLVDHHFGKKEK